MFTDIWTQSVLGQHDSRISLIEQGYGTLSDIPLLYQAILGELPDTQSINTIAKLELGDTVLAQLAYDYFVAHTPAAGT